MIKTLSKNEIPAALNEIPEPPEKLYILGELPDENNIYLTVVGSRKHTSYGKDVCEALIEGLRGQRVVIVSGLALGIDSIAHTAALNAGLRTISFPGSGLDESVLYPASNRYLAKQIVESGGGLISEFDPKFKPTPWSFLQRNRLMAGISKAVLIIEAEQKSGTLVTARLGLDYNRDVLVVPGSIHSHASKGTNSLIRQGATPITGVDDLFEALGLKIPDKGEKQQRLFADCTTDEKKILEFLVEPKSRDDLVRELGLPTPTANALLSIMEIKDMIKESGGLIQRNF